MWHLPQFGTLDFWFRPRRFESEDFYEGLGALVQFSLLVLINVFEGMMVEPVFAARVSETAGRRKVLVIGWLIGIPVPFIIIFANRWVWFDFANVLLGVNQALCWSMTVIMKVDLVGPRRRGLALGLNEFAGYVAVGFTAWITGYIASVYGLRPQPFYLGIGVAFAGLLLSWFFAKETLQYATLEAELHHAPVASATGRHDSASPRHGSLREIFALAS